MKQLHKNISFTAFHQLFVTALAFVLVPVATRYLGAQDYGLYTLATTIGFFVGLLADLGTSTILTRELAKHPKIASRFFATIITTKLFLIVLSILGLLGFLALAHYEPRTTRVILVFAISSVMGSFTLAAFGVFRGLQQMQFEAVGVSMDKLISVAIGITLLVLGFGIHYFIWSFVVSSTVLFFFSYFVIYRRLLAFQLRWRWSHAKIILSVSMYLGVSAFLSMAYNYLDILMLSKMSNFQDIGYYSAAYRILMVTRIFPTILATAFLPQFSSQSKDGLAVSSLFAQGVGYLLMIILPLVPATVVLSKPIMAFVAGQEFISGAPALRILAFATAAQMLNIFFVPLYVATNFQNKIVHFQIIGLFVNIGLNLLLIPTLSFIGAAYATVATEVSIFLFILFWIRKKLGFALFPPKRLLLKITGCTLAMMAFVVFALALNFHIILIVFVGLASYALVLLITKTVDLGKLIGYVVSR